MGLRLTIVNHHVWELEGTDVESGGARCECTAIETVPVVARG